MSIIKQQLALDQITYRKPISIVKQFLDHVMQMRPQAPVRITPRIYPSGWTAEVAAEDKVWTIECNRGDIALTKVADLCGHTPNYQYIKSGEEDISKYERHFLIENNYYRCDTGDGSNILPFTCDLFCNEDENECQFCPFERRLKK